MRNKFWIKAVSIISVLMLASCNVISVPQNEDTNEVEKEPAVINPHALPASEKDREDKEEKENEETSDEKEVSQELLTDSGNQDLSRAQYDTEPIPNKYGSILDDMIFVNYDDANQEVTKYQFFFVDENLYFEETWGAYDTVPGNDEYVMSYFAGEVLVSDSDDISYEDDVLKIPCKIMRFSSFSNAGDYWDDGIEAEIIFDGSEIVIDYSDDEEPNFYGAESNDTSIYDMDYTFDLFEESGIPVSCVEDTQYLMDWSCDINDTHYFVRMGEDGNIVFLSKKRNQPVDLKIGIYGYDEVRDGALHIVWAASQIGNANTPEGGLYFIKIQNGQLYWIPEDPNGDPDENNAMLFQGRF